MEGPAMTGACTIRPLAEADLPDFVAMVADLSAQQGHPTGHFSVETARRDVLGPQPRLMVLVADAGGGRLAGYAALNPAYETSWAVAGAYMQGLYVARGHRRRGIARALVAAAGQLVLQSGGAYLWWTSRPDNPEGQAFYDALGASRETLHVHSLSFDQLERLAPD